MPSTLRTRIHSLQRSMEAADRTGQAYAKIRSLLEANPPTAADGDPIGVEVWLQEIKRLDDLVAEMTETSVSDAHEIATLERRAAAIG